MKTWEDLTETEKLRFARQVADTNLVGWEELKIAASQFGFEPDEDMPTVFELRKMAYE